MGANDTDDAPPSLAPQTRVIRDGFDPRDAYGAVKPPIVQTSTFVFESAAAAAAHFRAAYAPDGAEGDGTLSYTRLDNPNFQVLEARLRVYDGAEAAAVFSSGMAAITTALLAHVEAGDGVLYGAPLYGGAAAFITDKLAAWGVRATGFYGADPEDTIRRSIARAFEKGPIRVVYVETPANPTNDLVDIAFCQRLCEEIAAIQDGPPPVLMVDNTMLGPVGQSPLEHGADLVLYSLTKHVGGHSDLVAGGAAGRADVIARMKSLRALLGGAPDPATCWLAARSLETLDLRMSRAFESARACAEFLFDHPKVETVRYLGFLAPESWAGRLHARQARGAGSTFSFTVAGGREAAFRVLDRLKVIRLAVSLGGAETLMCHPETTTHSNMTEAQREAAGITPDLLRIAVGLEEPGDLIADLDQALAGI